MALFTVDLFIVYFWFIPTESQIPEIYERKISVDGFNHVTKRNSGVTLRTSDGS